MRLRCRCRWRARRSAGATGHLLPLAFPTFSSLPVIPIIVFIFLFLSPPGLGFGQIRESFLFCLMRKAHLQTSRRVGLGILSGVGRRRRLVGIFRITGGRSGRSGRQLLPG